MRIHLLAIGTRMPDWVATGYEEYARRLPGECRLELKALVPRGRAGDTATRKREEGQVLLGAVPGRARVVALDERGKGWSTRELAAQLARWMDDGRDVALLVGGADGLAPECLARAEQQWSLSPLTLPHMMVRVLVAEQIYRANALNHGHPYHRD